MSETQTKAHEADDGQVPLNFTEEAQEVEIETAEAEPESQEQVAETAQEEDDEHEQYSKSVQKRINQLTKKSREAERQREEAIRYAQNVQSEAENLRQRLQNLDKSYIDEYGYRVNIEQKNAEAALKQALDMGDSEAAIEAQKRLSSLAIAADKHSQAKQNRERQAAQALASQQQISQTQYQQPVQQQVQPQPQPDEKAEEWAERNKWFGEDHAMTFAAFGIHKQLIEDEGFDPKSDDYYNELDQRMRDEFPNKLGEQTQSSKRPAQTVASASRTSSGGRGKKVKLTPSQVTIAKRLGVPLEEYAKYVRS